MPEYTVQSTTTPRLSAWIWIPPAIALLLTAAILLADSNQHWFLLLNAHAAAISPVIWSGLTNIASTGGAYAIVSAALPWQPRWGAAALLALPAGSIFTHGLKDMFSMSRPAGVLSPDEFNLIGDVLKHNALPSGHSVTAFGIGAAIALCCVLDGRRWLAWIALGIALVTAFSRIAVGAHWPLDVTTGAVGGWVCGALGVWLSMHWRFWQRDLGIRVMAIILGASAIWLFIDDLKYPEGEWAQYVLAVCGTLGALLALIFGRRWSRT